MRNAQRGVTLMGWLVLLVPVSIVGYAALRTVPHYLNYFRVLRSMQALKAEVSDGGATTAQALRGSLEKRFEIESIEKPDVKDIDIHRDGDHWVVGCDYADVEPLFANVSITVTFTRQIEL